LDRIGSAVGMDSGAPKAGGRKGSPAPTYLPLGAPPGRYGYTPLVWTVVMLNAFGGLCVAVVVKYASRACAGRPLAPLRIALPVVRGAGRMRTDTTDKCTLFAWGMPRTTLSRDPPGASFGACERVHVSGGSVCTHMRVGRLKRCRELCQRKRDALLLRGEELRDLCLGRPVLRHLSAALVH
jgi:hypothetical protein